MANVLAYGADPTGVANSTAAIVAAIAATPVSGTVCFPYTATGGTYLCDSDQINAAGRRLQGDAAHASTVSTIKARTAGTALVVSSSECAVESLKLDANNLSQYAISLTNADRSELLGVEAVNALAWGILITGGERLYCRGLYAHDNVNGIRIIGSDNSEFYACAANINDTVGLYVAGVGSGLTANDGNIKWYGGAIDLNTVGPQVIFDGVLGALFSGPYIEGASPCLQLDNDASNNCFEFLRMVLGDGAGDYAVNIIAGNQNSFFGCSAPGTNGRRVRLDGVNAVNNSFIGCYRASALAIDGMTLYFDDGGGGTYSCEQRQAGFTGATAPTEGTWRVGDLVFDSTGANVGWQCTVAGTPGTWTAF